MADHNGFYDKIDVLIFGFIEAGPRCASPNNRSILWLLILSWVGTAQVIACHDGSCTNTWRRHVK